MVVTDYNEQFLDKRGTDHLIDELKAYINGIATGNIDLSNYVTKEELQAKLDALDINIDLSSYATKEELTNAINSIDLSSYAKKTDIPTVPTKTSQLTNDSGFLTQHQDLSAYATTEYVDNAIANVPTTDLTDYAKTSDIPTKVSELENDSNYLSSIPEEYVTETELSAKGYLTEHQDISGKVDKVEGKSLISDTEIARLATVDNYDDTDIRTKLANKADITDIPTTVAELTDSTDYAKKTDIPTSLPANGGNSSTVNGHTVKSDVPENAKFTDTVYDDTEVKGSIDELNSNLHYKYNTQADVRTQGSGFFTGVYNYKFRQGRKYTLSTIDSLENDLNFYGSDGLALDDWLFKLNASQKTVEFVPAKDFEKIYLNYYGSAGVFDIKVETSDVGNACEQISKVNESLEDYNLDNKYDGIVEKGYFDVHAGGQIDVDDYHVHSQKYSVNVGDKVTLNIPNGVTSVTFMYWNGDTLVGSSGDLNSSRNTVVIPDGANIVSFHIYKEGGVEPSNVGHIGVYVNNEIDQLKNDLDKLNSLPIGSIIQIEAAKDNIETTEQKYGWQYLGTSKIECEHGATMLLLTNVYRKYN